MFLANLEKLKENQCFCPTPPSWPQNNPLGILLAILSIILAQKWSPWGSSWLSWAPSWRKSGPLGAPLHHLGPKMVPLGLLLAILGTILAQNGQGNSLYIHKLPINRKAAETCNIKDTK